MKLILGRTEAASIPFRLTQAEAVSILPGLLAIIRPYVSTQTTGYLPFSDYFRIYPHLRLRPGQFNEELIDLVFRLFKMLAPWKTDGARTHRVRLGAVAIAALAFGVRIADTCIRHGHANSGAERAKAMSAHLRRKLEKLRRRAVRKCAAAGFRTEYLQAAEQWRRFETWVRANLTYCDCHRPKTYSPRPRYQAYVDRVARLIEEVSAEEELVLPDANTGRLLARRVCQYARRGRLAAGIPDLLKGSDRARLALGEFLRNRLPKHHQTEP